MFESDNPSKIEDNNKKEHTTYTAEYSMGQKYYDIYGTLLQEKIKASCGAMMKEESALRPYFVVLFQIYLHITGQGMYEPVSLDFKKRFDETYNDLKIYELQNMSGNEEISFPDKLLEDLKKIDEDLQRTMQRMGLGINLRKNVSKKKLLKKAFLGGS